MPFKRLAQSLAAIAILLAIVLGGLALMRHRLAPDFIVSQRGRAFHPNVLSIRRGEVVRIVNDDGDLSHHAYVKTDRFSFDSGDQLPGSKTDITFSVPGTYNVLCGIHPKMKLVVEVK